MNKRNRTLIICGIVWAVIAIAFLILGFALSGHDIIGWFSSKWAMLLYIFLAVYAIIAAIIIIFPKIRRM